MMSTHIATFATIFFSMILVNNYVLVQFLGICPFLGVSKKLDSSAGMGAAVIVVMVIATAVTFPLQIFLLDAYMQPVQFLQCRHFFYGHRRKAPKCRALWKLPLSP